MATLLFSFGGLFQVSVLLINSLAVLSEDRFLARIGWGTSQQSEPTFGSGGMQDPTSLTAKFANLINSVRTLMRIPLIFLNIMIIIWAVAFG
ncbi:hypothetical protein CERZMDRAFT_92104 [Cercospora zeae-maydis SCOH1-5]|uniref:Yos1-like protein n=1 Tax=Cercospora zeae-maydis SCOH1-5 TaxID=717836 RepID=A0A6A6FVC8_9PEZI|nr:hypothetical protein CERZMDRAFT_92104 [Cercospora zeae-maydis SCOH1-5]